MTEFNKNQILALIEKHSQLDDVDRDLTQKLLEELDLDGTCALGSVLKSELKIEREAALIMIKKHLDALLSDNKETVEKTKDLLSEFYYCVDTSGILEP